MAQTPINPKFPILLIFLLVLEMEIMDNLFPFSGPKSFINLPAIYILCSITIVSGIFFSDKIKSPILFWLTVFVINSLIIFLMYPK